MYYLFFGGNTVEVRKKAYQCIDQYEKKEYAIESIDSDSFESGMLADTIGAVSLFGEKTLCVIDTPSSNKEFYDEVVAYLKQLEASENTFVIIEGSLPAAEKKKFVTHAEKHEEVVAAVKDRFNAFSLADALAKKDKKSLWLLLQQAQQVGLPSEEIIGILWWQLKSLRLAQYTTSTTQAGMKDFPYNKAKRSLHLFKEDELEKLSQSLLLVYHDGHKGKKDIALALEQWTLSM